MGGATTGEVNLTAGNRPLRVRSISVDAHLLKTLGVQPAQGRFFSEEETDRAGAWRHRSRFSHAELWQTVFGGQPLVGQTVNVEGRPTKSLASCHPASMSWTTARQSGCPSGSAAIRQNRGFHILHVIGRLKDGVTAQAAQTELNAFLENWGERAARRAMSPRIVRRARQITPFRCSQCRTRLLANPPFDLDTAGRCRVRPADRVRESRQPADGPCRVTSS